MQITYCRLHIVCEAESPRCPCMVREPAVPGIRQAGEFAAGTIGEQAGIIWNQ
jgi:hypothetical protein